MNRQVGVRVPRPVYNAIRQATTMYGAVQVARNIMGSYAPTEKDIETIWNYAQKAVSGSKSGASGRYGRSKKGYKKPMKKLKNQVKELKRLSEADMGTHIHRVRGASRVLAGVNESNFSAFTGITTSTVESALSNLKYYNPSVPGTLTTAAGATGSFQKEFLIKNIYSKLLVSNNYQVPCNVILYVLSPRADTSIAPDTAFSNGLTDVGGVSATSALMHPTDSEEFNDLWNIVKSKSVRLQPGDVCSISHSIKPFSYDPATVDSHGHTYQGRFGSHTYGVRIEGALGHDITANEQGFLQSGIDTSLSVKYEIKYPAGADIKQFSVSDGASTFTNAGVVSEKPVGDNIQYSVA